LCRAEGTLDSEHVDKQDSLTVPNTIRIKGLRRSRNVLALSLSSFHVSRLEVSQLKRFLLCLTPLRFCHEHIFWIMRHSLLCGSNRQIVSVLPSMPLDATIEEERQLCNAPDSQARTPHTPPRPQQSPPFGVFSRQVDRVSTIRCLTS